MAQIVKYWRRKADNSVKVAQWIIGSGYGWMLAVQMVGAEGAGPHGR
jgi:hypothetical protein